MSREQQRCPDEVVLARALSEGSDAVPREHVSSCARCHSLQADAARVVALGKRLSCVDLPEDRVESLRTEILSHAAMMTPLSRDLRGHTPRRWFAPAIAVAAAAVALLAVLSLQTRQPSPTPGSRRAKVYRGTSIAESGASFVRIGAQPNEIVRLLDGALHVEVATLQAGERFRVVTSDAEIEVHGTAFDVVADQDHLVLVQVRRGHVEVRPARGAAILLAPGQRWDRPPLTLTPSMPSTLVARRDREVAHVAHTRPATHAAATVEEALPIRHQTAEEAFRDGWRALRDGKSLDAMASFERAMALEPDSPFAEDACFWHAVTLARSGQRTGAEVALTSFLARYESSPRAGEASAMLGWLLLEHGSLEQARARFLAAEADRSASVSESARAGLAKLRGRDARP